MKWNSQFLLFVLFLLPVTPRATVVTCNCQQQATTTLDVRGTEHKQRSGFDQDETSFEGNFIPATEFKAFRTLQFHNDTEKRDILELGTKIDPFIGPRKRRSVTSLSPYTIYTIPQRHNSNVVQKKTSSIDERVKFNAETTTPQQRFRGSGASLSQTKEFFKQNNVSLHHRQKSGVYSNLRFKVPPSQRQLQRKEQKTTTWQQMTENVQGITAQPPISAAQIENEILQKDDTLKKGAHMTEERHEGSITLEDVVVTEQSPIQPMNKNANIQPMRTKDLLKVSPEIQTMELVIGRKPEEIAIASALRDYGPGVQKIPRHGQFESRTGDWIQFQPMTSEWSTQIGQPLQQEPIQEPGFLTRLLSNYINLELNNYEVTDFVRKLSFALVLISLSIAWILFGIFVGVIPSKWFHWPTQRNLDEESIWPNSIIKGITEHVSLALDGDWLEKLEERVSSGGGGWLATSVSCCILPSEKSQGHAECEVVRKGRKVSTFKCLSDLIYNFNFGPSET